MKKTVFILLSLLLCGNTAWAQTEPLNPENIRMDRRIGISLKLGSNYDILGGLEADFFLLPVLNIEADILHIGLLSTTQYYGGGVNYYPLGNRANMRLSPYIGLLAGHASGTTFLNGEPIESTNLILPAGINYIGKRGINLAFDLSAVYVNETRGSNSNTRVNKFFSGPIPGVIIGYRF